jgi:hypothetical protein
MAADRQPDAAPSQPAPRLASLRVPADPSPIALAGNAHTLWRLGMQKKAAPVLESGNPDEEYRSVCEFMRLYATLRFYQLALLLGTTGSIVTALSSHAVQISFARGELLKTGGLLISIAFLIMEFRASSYWHRLRDRGNALASTLRYEPFPEAWRWNPLTTSGAGFYLHVLITALWLFTLFFNLQPGF